VIEEWGEITGNFGIEFDRPGFARDVHAIRIGHIPIFRGIEPRHQVVLADNGNGLFRGVTRDGFR